MGKLPPDRRADLRDLLGRSEPVETRHQRGVQAGGNRKRRRRNRRDRACRPALALGLQHRLRHFLHEQRNAVGALDDVLPNMLPAAGCCRRAARSWAITSRGASRLSVSAVTCGRPIHGVANSGRTSRPAEPAGCQHCPRARPNNSRLVGSAQCASSKIISTGSDAQSPRSGESSASNVFCRRCCGASSSAG